MKLPLLVVILGPTASGKTSLSLRLAEHFQGEIVSCDSVAVYRELEIGAAKPSADDRRRVPHHLIDVVSVNEYFTAGDYARRARQTLNEIQALRQQMVELRDTTTKYDMSFDAALQRLESRMGHLEGRVTSVEQETNSSINR